MKIFSIVDPVIATLLSWLFLLVIGNLELSYYSRPLQQSTNHLLISIAIVCLLFVRKRFFPRMEKNFKINILPLVFYLIVFCIGFILNSIYSGYIPLVSLIADGDSKYLDFGVKSISGFLNAMGCGIFVYSVMLLVIGDNHRCISFLSIGVVVFVFVMSFSRQNLLTSLIEALIVCYIFGKINIKKIIAVVVGSLMLFSIAGSYRSGDIKEIARVKDDYMWVPESFVWVYSYSYFNVLNLENIISAPDSPRFDGSSFANLLPSFIRGEKRESDFLAVSNFNVRSAAAELYYDIGYYGVVLFFVIVCYLTSRLYSKKKHDPYSIYCISVFWFCGAFSFFVNFWFYLPVISQLVINYPLLKMSIKNSKKII